MNLKGNHKIKQFLKIITEHMRITKDWNFKDLQGNEKLLPDIDTKLVTVNLKARQHGVYKKKKKKTTPKRKENEDT